MAKLDVWPAAHRERKALADDLRGLPTDRWATPSLCEGWTVREVLAHMTATAKISGPTFFAKMLSSGFSLKRMQAKDIAAGIGATPGETFAGFEAVTSSTKHPPGPIDTMLGETLVHSEDIRRPLGIRHEYPNEVMVAVADFYKDSNLIIGTKRRIAGLTLRADDTSWTSGEGPLVSGPMLSLVVSMTGRKAAIDDLSGDGVAILRGRD